MSDALHVANRALAMGTEVPAMVDVVAALDGHFSDVWADQWAAWLHAADYPFDTVYAPVPDLVAGRLAELYAKSDPELDAEQWHDIILKITRLESYL